MNTKNRLNLPLWIATFALGQMAHSATTVTEIVPFNPSTYFSGGITAGIDFDVDSDGAAGFQAATQPGFLSVPAGAAGGDYNVTHNGITFNINTVNNNLSGQHRWRGATTAVTAGVLINDFEQFYGRQTTTGLGVTATITLTGLEANTLYDVSFFMYNVGAGQTNHRFYEGTSTSDPLLANFTTAGNQNTYSTWKPGINFRIDSGADSTIAVTIYAPEFVAGTNYESRLTLDGISVVAIPEPSAAMLGLVGVLGILRRRRLH
jgi:hypothetical protein